MTDTKSLGYIKVETTDVDEKYYTAEEITADSCWGQDWPRSEPLAEM